MQFTLALFALASFFASQVHAKEGDVHTAAEVFHTMIKEEPYMVDMTRTVVWTEGPAMPTEDVVPPEATQTFVFGEEGQKQFE